ncbi:MAG: hypothetical protein ABIT16_02470 [Croceibacterium sp.]
MSELQDAISYISQMKVDAQDIDKAGLQGAFIERFRPTQKRSVFIGNGYAFRFCEAQAGGFSNTVLSLSALSNHDAQPLVLVINRPQSVSFMLANATFLKKISHSSHQLRTDNIKGSFNGSDVLSSFEGIENTPGHFDDLFAHHQAFTWQENVERLVEQTNGIVARDGLFRPTKEQLSTLLDAGERAAAALDDPAFQAVEAELQSILSERSADLLDAAMHDNVNLRGNAIEQIITGGKNAHGLGDIERTLDGPLIIDVKTKLLDRASAPKAYNIDNALDFLATPGSVFAFFLVTIDTKRRILEGRLLPILETSIIAATRVQFHWAGRLSRGVTQLTGNLGALSNPQFEAAVDPDQARTFLQTLLDVKQEAALA